MMGMLTLRGICGAIVRYPYPPWVKLMSSSSSSISGAPWLIWPQASVVQEKTVDELYSVRERKVLRLERSIGNAHEYDTVGSSHGWLALSSRLCDHMFLLNPFTGRSIDLPPIRTLSLELDHINDTLQQDLIEEGRRVGASKVIISCSPEEEEEEEEEECMAVMRFGECKLAFCFPGRRGAKWTCFHWGICTDFSFSTTKKLLTTISRSTLFATFRIADWDLRGAKPRVDWSDFNYSSVQPEYDAERGRARPDVDWRRIHHCRSVDYVVNLNSEQSFLVRQYAMQRELPSGYLDTDRYPYPAKSIGFVVVKLDRYSDNGRTLWKVMYDGMLDGMAIFVGLNNTFALDAAAHQLQPNSIYFSDSRLFKHHSKVSIPQLSGSSKYMYSDSTPFDKGAAPMKIRRLIGCPHPGYDCAGDNKYWYEWEDVGIFDTTNGSISSLCDYVNHPACHVQSRESLRPPPMWLPPTLH